MGRLISKKTVERKNEFDSRQHKSNLSNICGTFAAEGMTISIYTRRNLDQIASGQTSYQAVLKLAESVLPSALIEILAITLPLYVKL